jgi:tRNA dimethylallyltransferase
MSSSSDSGVDMPGTALVVVAGPTGVGKTQAAIELAHAFDAELVGADSVQVYRGFDIGASKPTPSELRGLPHHLIDIREPEDTLDASSYAALADQAIAEVHARGRLPIVVGGTGLWLRALLQGLVSTPKVDPALRMRLEAQWQADGPTAMHVRLTRVDPESARRIHPNDKLRVVRALEVYEQTGLPLGAARIAHALGEPRYRALTFVVDLPTAHHQERVRTRVRQMVEQGLVAEVESLLAKHGRNVRPMQAVGYKQMVEHVTQGVALDATQTAIVRATLIYARRQRTWWRSDRAVWARLTPEALLGDDARRAIEALRV